MNEQNEAAQMVRPAREKYWEECDDAMKMERLREMVVRLEQANQLLAANVLNLLQHRHGADGQLLQPLREAGANLASGALGGVGYGVLTRVQNQHERDRRW